MDRTGWAITAQRDSPFASSLRLAALMRGYSAARRSESPSMLADADRQLAWLLHGVAARCWSVGGIAAVTGAAHAGGQFTGFVNPPKPGPVNAQRGIRDGEYAECASTSPSPGIVAIHHPIFLLDADIRSEYGSA